MDINTIWNSIITIKIRKDDSYNFTLREIETFAKVYDMKVEDFCINVLKLSKQQIRNLKGTNYDFVKCTEYKRAKEEFFARQGSTYRLRIIKEKIKQDYSKQFSLDELKYFSLELGVNLEDLCINILGISRHNLNNLKNGTYKEALSKKYEEDKEGYLRSIENDVLESILSSKMKTDFSSQFTYKEITGYSSEFGINIRELLGRILGIDDYAKQRKSISKTGKFWSNKYRTYKHQRMQIIGEEILESFVVERMRKTGDHQFSREEIYELSKKYNINVRDFMVYVLGKSEQLYYDFREGRINKCFSQKYKSRKDEIIIFKRENFMSEVNPNIRTYYSLEQLENLASNLGISIYDLVVNVMGKSRQSYYNISTGYNDTKSIYIGEHKAGALPNEYCKTNVREILEILRIATRSAIGYMSPRGYKCAAFYNDLLQEGYVYLATRGNPIDENGIFKITTNKYEENHGAILYKKAYFNAIGKIREFSSKEYTGEVYDVSIKTQGITDEVSDDEDVNAFIGNLSTDDVERQVLKYFSENAFNDETVKAVCKKFKVDSTYIQNLFAKLREKLSSKNLDYGDK